MIVAHSRSRQWWEHAPCDPGLQWHSGACMQPPVQDCCSLTCFISHRLLTRLCGGKLPSYLAPTRPPDSIAGLLDAVPDEPVTLSQLPLAAWKQTVLWTDLARPPSASMHSQVKPLLRLPTEAECISMHVKQIWPSISLLHEVLLACI